MRNPEFLTPLMNGRIVLKQKNLLYVLCIKRTILKIRSSEDPLRICARTLVFTLLKCPASFSDIPWVCNIILIILSYKVSNYKYKHDKQNENWCNHVSCYIYLI